MRYALVAMIVAITLVAPSGVAQPTGDDAAAEALFTEGRKLMDEQKFAEACPKFQKSAEISPAVGTLLNLGECYERIGRMASAWSRYKAAENLAAKLKDKRQSSAAQRASAVEPKLSRITIIVSDEAKLGGLKIFNGDVELKQALWGTAAPIDAGTHVIRANAPGRAEWKTEVQVGDAASSSVTIPVLDSAASAPTPPASADEKTAAGPLSTQSEAPKDEKGGLGGQRTWALVAGGVGVVGVGVGTFLALGAKSKHDDAKKHCTNGSDGCDARAESLSRDARAQGNLATVAFGVGIVGLATGAVLWFTAPKKSHTVAAVGPIVTPNEAGLFVSGRLP